MTEFSTVFVSGTIYWAKIVGKPVDNYERDGKEWTYDFVPDDTSFLKEHRLLDRLKEAKDPIHDDYIRLKKPAQDKDGYANDPIEIVNEDGEPWGDTVKIGNGSKVDLRLTIADFGKGRKKAIWTKAIRVTEHVPFEGASDAFADMDRAKGSKKPTASSKKPSTKASFDEDLLDDDVPF